MNALVSGLARHPRLSATFARLAFRCEKVGPVLVKNWPLFVFFVLSRGSDGRDVLSFVFVFRGGFGSTR